MKTIRKTRTILILAGICLSTVVTLINFMHQNQLHDALIAAIDRNDLAVIRSLLQQGADPNAPVFLADNRSLVQRLSDSLLFRRYPRFPLSILNYVILPIEFRQPVSASAYYKFHDSPDIVQALLDAGALVENRSAGDNALLEAAHYGEFKTMKVLIQHGANINATDKYGQTALLMTAYFGNEQGAEFLLHRGANIHVQCGKTTLLMVVLGPGIIGEPNQKTERDIFKTVQCLLMHGADVTGMDTNGQTVLNMAQRRDDIALIQILKQAGAK